MVAGGQPAGKSFVQNVKEESEEEASLPPEVVANVISTGIVSYKVSFFPSPFPPSPFFPPLFFSNGTCIVQSIKKESEEEGSLWGGYDV